MAIARVRVLIGCWINSEGRSRNLQTGAPLDPFASARTHKSSLLSTASSRSADNPIATRERMLRKVRVAPEPEVSLRACRAPNERAKLPDLQ